MNASIEETKQGVRLTITRGNMDIQYDMSKDEWESFRNDVLNFWSNEDMERLLYSSQHEERQ